MKRWLIALVVAASGCAALAFGLNFIAADALRRPALADAPRLETGETAQQAEPVPAPEARPVLEKPPLTPDQEAVLLLADQLTERTMAQVDEPVLAAWKDRFASHSSFVYEDASSGRWITLSAARVDCSEVDRVLRRYSDPSIGRPDRCQRWIDKAAQAMARHRIEGKTPREFLAQLGADMTVRVHLVYASWQRDPDSNEIRLVADNTVPVYPQTGFADREYAARDNMYRHQKLGPYAEDRAVGSL